MLLKDVVVDNDYVVNEDFQDGLLTLMVGEVVRVHRVHRDVNFVSNFPLLITKESEHHSKSWVCPAGILRLPKYTDEPRSLAYSLTSYNDNDEPFPKEEYKRLYTHCAVCGKEMKRSEVTSTVPNIVLCEDCLKSMYSTCEVCGHLFPNEEIDSILDENDHRVLACEDCREAIRREAIRRKVIHILSYHHGMHCDGQTSNYGMTPLMDGKRVTNSPYEGVELEIDCGGENDDNARQIIKTLGREYAVPMHDGSLNDGFEIVSTPATLEHHMHTIHWQEAMQKATDLNYQSHSCGTCGLHVHVDRKFFGRQQDTEEKFYILFRNNLPWIKKFSRRSHYDYCHINGAHDDSVRKYRKGAIDKVYVKSKIDKGNRYLALNFTRKNTIEFRIFRGTLKYETFIATLQFVDLFARFVKASSEDDIAEITLDDFVRVAKERGYASFINYLKERKIITEQTGKECA